MPTPTTPELPPAYFFLGKQLRQPVQAQQEGRRRANDSCSWRTRSRITRSPRTSCRRRTTPRTRSSASSSLQYLVAAYGPDKLNDPGKAEPVLQHMIQLDPADPANYFRLAQALRGRRRSTTRRSGFSSRRRTPGRTTPAVYTIAGRLLQPQGQLRQDDRRARAAGRRRNRDNPEACQTIARLLLGQGPQRLAPEGQREEETTFSRASRPSTTH